MSNNIKIKHIKTNEEYQFMGIIQEDILLLEIKSGLFKYVGWKEFQDHYMGCPKWV